MNNSRDKQAKSLQRRVGPGKPLKRKLISSNRSTNQGHKDNYDKAKLDKTQQNSKCQLCRVTVETINNIISKCSKLDQNSIRRDT